MKKSYLQKKNRANSGSISLKNTAIFFLVFLGYNAANAQLNGCGSGAGGQLTVGTSCSPVTFNLATNTDYWDGATGCNSEDLDDAWGWFDAIATTTIITYTPTTKDAILHLFTGSCSTTMTALACADANAAGGAETITYATTIGVRYLIRIQRYNSNNDMDGSICVYSPQPPPTITNLSTASSGCVGSSITITGTNFTGVTAANVKIGGTAVSSITSNNGTTIVAVVGSGTTGTVSVTNATATATSVGVFTVNPLPANPGNPTSNSPQCNPPGVTLTRAATPPGTANYYWQTTSLGTNTSNNTSTYTATTSGTYYIRAQTISTGCWSAGEGSLAVVINPNISTLASSPSPADASTGVCYGGPGAITSASWTAAAGATSYDVYFGSGSLPGTVTSNVATTSYTIGVLAASTTYYWKIVPKNSCGISSGTPIIWTFTTGSAPCSCTPTGNLDCTSGDYISNVTFNTLNNTTACGLGGYTIYPATGVQTSTLTTGQAYTFSLSVGPRSGTHGAGVWIDFNNNDVFTDAGEFFLIGNAIAGSSTTSVAISIPAGATLGTVKMRVRYAYLVTVASTMSCTMSGTYGETEDYAITLIAPTTCTTPTAQPTSLAISSITATSITGSFTAASPSPSGYLIVRSTTATAPSPVNGTTYAVGSTVFGVGTIVIQGSVVTSNAVTFTDTGLISNTKYYYYIFSYNNACSGAPYYFTSSPLSNNAVTCVAAIASAPVNSAITGTSCTISWGASPAGGSAATINYTLEVYSDSGYSSPISGSPFSVGTPITYSLTGLNGGTVYYYRVRSSNGSCYSAYQTGTVTTTLTNDNCSGAVLVTVNPNTACTINATGTSTGATQSQVGCAGNADDDVWFRFVATGTSHIVTVSPLTLNNVVFEVFNGNCAGLTSRTCVNATNGTNDETTTLTGLTPGSTYYVRVYSNGNATNTGTFTICITTPVPPSNNQCTNAITLPCGTTNLAGTTVLSASYPHGTGCIMSNYGVWYSFAGDGNSSTISVTTTNNDIELSISSGTCGSLTNIACQDSALSSGTETYTFTTAVGVTYYIYIANWYSAGLSTDTGTFTISRTCVVPYNPCTSITTIAACGSSTTTTIAAGNGGYSPSSCGWTTPGIEKIYTFTPASTGNFSITQASSFDYINYQFKPVSSGCGSSGWTCIDSMAGAVTSSSFTLTAGIQYYILLDPESSSGGSVTFTINCPTATLPNDEPCNAIALTVSATCSYATYTNSGAAGSGGVTAPGCAGYNGGDVWFSAIVPATGELDVDLQSGGMTDSGMAFYSGTCGALTLLECDDDDSTNGAMSYISMNGLTPGQTIYIRVWEYGNDSNGTFGICATTPSCPSPSNVYANILSTTSVSVYWNASTPPASGGYQYYINTTGTAPTAATTPTGSTAAGVIGVTLSGLTAGVKYYFWVRSYCGGPDTSAWFGPTNYTPCAVGNGTGTTTLTCPSITAGGQGQNGANPPAQTCSALTCVNLEATYLQLNQPTDYTVTAIPYSPPYQYTCLQNPVSVNVDDVWSPIINLPFNFCFYGNNYDKCLIGSNGVITFNTTTNTPGGYSGWSFNSDLPNVSLFKNTIFGVYQDIDPSKGGQVGWELITLNSGCRALVASWNNIPMYSSTCNSSLYTGMIVLHENTNVIEVYIKEKNACTTWNDGNAIVGIQNSTGTAAVVAPNRNGLSANWTVTNEAWRFTPSGPSLTSIQWYEGTPTTGVAIPGGTTDVLNVCPTISTLYTAEVTYALCNGNLKYTDNSIVTVNGNKIWDGSTDNNWNVADNWTPTGVPTSANCVIVPITANNPVISNAPDAVGYNLAVYNGAQLTINPNKNLTITDKVTVQPTGIFTINNSASLIQINNILNSGNIIYKRDSPSIRTLDYVYWSSPVSGFNVNNIVIPYSFGGIYKWNTTIANTNGYQGNWQNAAGDIMAAGKGYIARAPGAAPFNNTSTNVLSGSFTGVPNNGDITIPIERGTDQNTALHYGTNGVEVTNLSDNWNLLGNPYPSAIRGSQFLFDNNTKILGNIRLWTHGTLPSVIQASPFYGSYLSNYTPGDYLTYNFTGTSCCPAAASDLFIGAGQGFFVQMIDGAPVAAADNITVAFNNNLRSAAYSNSSFYKMQNSTTASGTNIDTIERNRIWLDLINPNNQTDRTLFGYIENATMGKDNFYDCITQNTGGTLIYSIADTTKFSIQGRALPFDVNDEVSIGVNTPIQGIYTIGIAAVDGLFNNQNIYLKDNLLNITHDLKANPYHFTASPGAINDRFKIIYIDNALGNPTHSFDNQIRAIVNTEVAVNSSNLEMESIVVYNLLGQKLNSYTNINTTHAILSGLHKNNTTLLLKIKLETGETVTRKIIF